MVFSFDGLLEGGDNGLNKKNSVTEFGIVVQVDVDLKIEKCSVKFKGFQLLVLTYHCALFYQMKETT